MATKTNQVIKNEVVDDGRVLVNLFKDDNKYKDDVPVTINGKTILIRRGEDVLIPKEYAEVLDNSQRQDNSRMRMCENLQSEYRQATRQLN